MNYELRVNKCGADKYRPTEEILFAETYSRSKCLTVRPPPANRG